MMGVKKRFAVIEHTADIGIVAYGSDLKEAFANAAYGFFSLITEPRRIRATIKREIEVRADDLEGLMVAWLGEFIYLFDVEQLLFKKFVIEEFSQTHLKATVYGEKVDQQRHRLKLGIKAVTRHQLSVVARDGVEARVIFDI